jgi:hypothetical protein
MVASLLGTAPHEGSGFIAARALLQGTHSSGLRMVNNVMERAAATTSMKLGDVANPSQALLSWSISDC